jgi:hypothetical protein
MKKPRDPRDMRRHRRRKENNPEGWNFLAKIAVTKRRQRALKQKLLDEGLTEKEAEAKSQDPKRAEEESESLIDDWVDWQLEQK